MMNKEGVYIENLRGECFTAAPSARNASAIHLSYRKLLKSNILYCLASAKRALSVDLSHIIEIYRQLAVRRRFSPVLYVVQTGLVEALRSGKTINLMDALQAMRLLPRKQIYDAKLRQQSILTEDWEHSFIDTVRAEQIQGVDEKGGIILPILESDISQYLIGYAAALELLEEADAELLAEYYEYVSRLKLFTGKLYYGFSSPVPRQPVSAMGH